MIPNHWDHSGFITFILFITNLMHWENGQILILMLVMMNLTHWNHSRFLIFILLRINLNHWDHSTVIVLILYVVNPRHWHIEELLYLCCLWWFPAVGTSTNHHFYIVYNRSQALGHWGIVIFMSSSMSIFVYNKLVLFTKAICALANFKNKWQWLCWTLVNLTDAPTFASQIDNWFKLFVSPKKIH